MFEPELEGGEPEKRFSARRIRTLLVGILVAAVVGLVLVNIFTYVQYGGTMFDRYFKKTEKSPLVGKLAFDKNTKYYIGVMRGEGRSPRRGNVFYIEQAGGNLIEVPKDNVEVRDPERLDK